MKIVSWKWQIVCHNGKERIKEFPMKDFPTVKGCL